MVATGPVFLRFHLSESEEVREEVREEAMEEAMEEGNTNLCEVLHASVFINSMINKRLSTWSLR
jgi:hypothetical protein